MKDLGIIVLACIVGIAVVVGFGSQLFLGKDNPVEEVAEEVIQKETGLKLDLSPPTPAPTSVITAAPAQPSSSTPSK